MKGDNEVGPLNSILLTEDGYATLESVDTKSVRPSQPQDYALPINKTSGYIHLQEAEGMVNEKADTNDDHDYEELFWEPANLEEELMAQISKLGLPIILSESVE